MHALPRATLRPKGVHQAAPLLGRELPLPGFSQATGQPGAAERERERVREEQIHIKKDDYLVAGYCHIYFQRRRLLMGNSGRGARKQ